MRHLWLLFLLAGCNASKITDPTERGLESVATAIVAAAIIHAIFNK